jgi:hypothetical protein
MNRRTPFTPGWDIVGVVDKLGDEVSTWQTGQMVAALPIVGGYAGYIFLPSNDLVPVPPGLDHYYMINYLLIQRDCSNISPIITVFFAVSHYGKQHFKYFCCGKRPGLVNLISLV